MPLGTDYIELIAVVDADEAAQNTVSRFLSHRLATIGEGLVALCLRTVDAPTTAKRTRSSPVPMSRTLPNGHELRWELLGMEGALREGLPFFITWPLDADHPARMPADHPSGAVAIARVELGGDPDRVRQWVGTDETQLHLVGGEPRLRRFAVGTPGAEIILN